MTSPDDFQRAIARVGALLRPSGDRISTQAELSARFSRQYTRTRHLLEKLGVTPPPLILVGGTSGKGSVAVLCASMLEAHGLRTGLYLSPYLQSPLEVARVNGRLMSREAAVEHIGRVLEAVEAVHNAHPQLRQPHYLEAWLGIALLALDGCDAAVIEVGMGGRFDRTNVLDPSVSVITTVNWDHVRMLGGTLESIAWHKAGIMRRGRPTVLGKLPEVAQRVVEAEAAAVGARLLYTDETMTTIGVLGPDGATFSLRAPRLKGVRVGMAGAHQVENAAVALRAVAAFAAQHPALLAFNEAAARQGLAAARFEGRLETVQHAPRVVLDGAHNAEKMVALACALEDAFAYERLLVVIGMLRSKRADAILSELAPLTHSLIATRTPVKGKPTLSPAKLAAAAKQASVERIQTVAEPAEAIRVALARATPADLVVVTGSLYLVGAVRALWYPTATIEAQGTPFPT